MKKVLLALAAAFALGSFSTPALACAEDCHCMHGANKAAAAKKAKAEKVSLEGTVVTSGCPTKAEKKKDCTGAALMVGDSKHLITKAAKGPELVKKVKDTEKLVKVTGTKTGDMLTVSAFEIKG